MKTPKTIIEQVDFFIFRKEFIDLIVEIVGQLPPEKQTQFERRVKNFGIKIINGIAKDAKECSNGEWIEIKQIVQKKLDHVVALRRREDLINPSNYEDFEASIWWMSEQGKEEDLELIHKIKKAPPYTTSDINQLLEIAEQRISERMADPNYVLKKEEKAYQQNKKEWDKKNATLYRAANLLQKLERLQGNLDQVKQVLGERWKFFSTSIHKSRQEVNSKNAEAALQTLENLFDELREFPPFSVKARATRRGGLISAFEQTPVIMNESLVRQQDMPDRIDIERLTVVLDALANEIQMID